jgi:hypothetical protein
MSEPEQTLPSYGKEHQLAGLATNSSWNDGPFSFSPNTNVMDKNTMPSDTAEAARQKTASVMAALRSGDAGAADKAMGDSEPKVSQGIVPLRWFKSKMGKSKKEKKGKEEDVIR